MSTHTPRPAAVSLLLVMSLALAPYAGCSTAPKTPGKKAELHRDVQETIQRFKQRDPTMQELFDSSAGYAVFPTVGKGGAGLGGAYGRGELYEGGQMVGYCDLSQGTIGFQLGGQTYSELIFFEDEAALRRFKSGNFAFAAQASAVAATAGASADADYEHGVLVFTMTRAGLMYEATIGGQNFSYEPK